MNTPNSKTDDYTTKLSTPVDSESQEDVIALINRIQNLVSREKADIVSRLYPYLRKDIRNFKKLSELLSVSRSTIYKWSDDYGYQFKEQRGVDENV